MARPNIVCLTCDGMITLNCKCIVIRWCRCKYPYPEPEKCANSKKENHND